MGVNKKSISVVDAGMNVITLYEAIPDRAVQINLDYYIL